MAVDGREVGRRGGRGTLGVGSGDPSSVHVRVHPLVDAQAFDGAPAGKGLDRVRVTSGGEKRAREADAERVCCLFYHTRQFATDKEFVMFACTVSTSLTPAELYLYFVCLTLEC